MATNALRSDINSGNLVYSIYVTDVMSLLSLTPSPEGRSYRLSITLLSLTPSPEGRSYRLSMTLLSLTPSPEGRSYRLSMSTEQLCRRLVVSPLWNLHG